MKELLILSGKGGTGKTTIASAFIKLHNAKVYADCDVDAPNLHLITSGSEKPKIKDYYGLPKAYIEQSLCIECNKCIEYCRFNAINVDKNGYKVEDFACEGCGVCEYVCQARAVSMKSSKDGNLIMYSNENRVFSTAQLKMGSGTSGLLVSQVKKQMREEKIDTDVAIIDGSPGIGCPVIASISGVDMVLIVAEPSVSGIKDMKRIVKTAENFGVKIGVCINKWDININNTIKIESYCQDNDMFFAGKIPFDYTAVYAINNGETIADIDCPAGKAVREIYYRTIEVLNQ